jgi:fructose-1-phosphate kinase PfkB-like protein
VAGFLAGWNGAKVRELLQGEGITGVFEEVPGETRECHALLDDGAHPTEINEAGPEVPQTAWERLLGRLPAGTVVLSGSLPPGIDDDTFVRLVADLTGPPVVDMSGSALAAAVSAGAAMISRNRRACSASSRRQVEYPASVIQISALSVNGSTASRVSAISWSHPGHVPSSLSQVPGKPCTPITSMY